ncbi:hypothetical protein WG66_011283 [Moniliophthora roreri]|nr:hypothetical protein WG66_011283 [Moniliophthora roreri]
MSVMLFVYGIYIVLFGICAHMHLGKDAKDRPNRLLYLAWTIVLFVLAILANTFESWDYIHAAIVSFVAAKTKEYEPFTEYATSYQLKTIRNSIIVLLAPVINITADSMLIHRCYIIWGSLRRVAFPLIFGSFVVNALGITSIVVMTKGQLDTSIESNLALLDKGITLNNGYLIGNAAFHGVLTLLTGVQIWLAIAVPASSSAGVVAVGAVVVGGAVVAGGAAVVGAAEAAFTGTNAISG